MNSCKLIPDLNLKENILEQAKKVSRLNPKLKSLFCIK